MAGADLARFVDRYTAEYVRHYPHPVERVWRAITDPAEFRAWFIAGTLEPRVGGAYQFGGPDFAGEVLALDPPRLIRLSSTGPTSAKAYLEYELSADGDGTRMRFVQHFLTHDGFRAFPDDPGGDLPGGPDTPWYPGSLGGWHEFFEALGQVLDGRPRRSGPERNARWLDLVETYRRYTREVFAPTSSEREA